MRLIFYQSINRLSRADFPQILTKNDEYFLDDLFQAIPVDESEPQAPREPAVVGGNIG